MAFTYKMKYEQVTDESGNELGTVRGLSLNDISALISVNKGAMDALFNHFNGMTAEAIAEVDVESLGANLLESAPSLAAQIILGGTDAMVDYDPNSPSAARDADNQVAPITAIMAAPAGVQIALITAIARMTFAGSSSPKKLIAQVGKMMGANLSTLPAGGPTA